MEKVTVWTRRQFLAATGGAVAGLAIGARPGPAISGPAASRTERTVTPASPPGEGPTGGSDSLASARASLLSLVENRALKLDDPWVLMHAVLPLGPEVRHGGEPVIDFVARTWVESVIVAGNTYFRFPLNVEAHPNHFLEILYATAVSPTRPFETRAGKVTRADLYAGAKALFSPALEGDELSWTVSVFTAEMRPGNDRFENAAGRAFTVTAVAEAAVQAAEATYRDTVEAMRGTKPYGRSAIQESACNGTHAVFGLLDALRNGYRANRLPERVSLLLRAALFRLGPEVALIDRVIGAGRTPHAQLNADAAKLQFLGHSLENVRFARRHKLYECSAAEHAQLGAAERELAVIAHRLVAVHDLEGLARQVPRAYRVILGDACHALRGLQDGAD